MTHSTTDTTTGTADHTATVDAYIAMLNETDPQRRASLAEVAWTEDGSYVDPLLEARGHAGLSDMAAGVHAQFPGQRFVRTTGIDAHHGLVRFGWELGDGEGTVTVAGIDVGVIAPDGRLSHIAGFFGPLPERDAA
ncbi:MAG: nuclear transport factor 2 family protein [Acidimicrobiales bacterium]|nr:nuclear transport factor 2 family protein [Acidimicrobiales bacterium]